MGSINIDNTGSGGGITLSSDGTNLLLGGTAIGGDPDLYRDNASSATTPSATGANAVAIGSGAAAAGDHAVALGQSYASGVDSFAAAIGNNSSAYGAKGNYSIAMGETALTSSNFQVAIGHGATGGSSSNNAIALGQSYVSGADSFAAAIATNSSSYGATGANSIAMGYLAKATGTGNVNIGYEGYATGASGSVAIGYRARATGTNAICLGQSGYSTASGAQSFAVGYGLTVSGESAAGFGRAHTISADFGTAFGRNSTIESNAKYSLAMGYEAKISQYGKNAHASGKFAAAGDAQGGQFILRADTTDATATVLTTDNSTAASTNQIVAASDTCITFDGTITAMQNGAQAYASWRIEGLLVNDGGTTTLANSATTVIDNQSSWVMALSADNTNNALAITCTGEASHNIRWVANIRTTEVTYA